VTIRTITGIEEEPMQENQELQIGGIAVASKTLRKGDQVLLWLPNTTHFFEGYVRHLDGEVAHVWVGPYNEMIRRPNGPLDPDDPAPRSRSGTAAPGTPTSRSRPTTTATR
jgi:hypothetical protein